MVQTNLIEVDLTASAPIYVFENLNGSSVSFNIAPTSVAAPAAIGAADMSNATDSSNAIPLALIRLGASSFLDVMMEADETELHGALDIINKVAATSAFTANDYVIVGAKNCQKIAIGGVIYGPTDTIHITIRCCTE